MEELTHGIGHLLRPVLDSEHKDEALGSLLSSCADQRVFVKADPGLHSVASLINTKLNESSSRFDGLVLLHTYLPQCSLDILLPNACSWMQFCLKSFTVPKTSHIAFTVFKILLEQSVSIPELSKHVSSTVVASFAEQLHQGVPPQAYSSALQCLEYCMRNYNGPCGPHRKVFERFLFSMVDSTGPERYKAARCVAMLPQIGGGGVGGIRYENSWVAQHHAIIRTIHLLLDELYANINELTLMGNKLEDVDPLPFPPIETTDPILLVQKLKNRLINISAYLMFMLVMPYPVPKEVSASCIMHLICRGLAVTGSSLGNSYTTHRLALLADLPFIHTALLKVLEALILFGQTNMLTFASLICKLAIQSLKWTSVDAWPFSHDRPFSVLRLQSYAIIKVWCGIAKSGSLVDEVAQQLVELSKCDIYSEKGAVSLSQSSMVIRKQNNQKRKGNSIMSSTTPTNLLPTNKSSNKDVSVAALQAMQAMIMSASYQVQPSVHKVLQETVVALLLKVTNKVEDSPIPYSDKAPRLELFKLLLQLVLDCHPNSPPPTSIALKLFSSGLRDSETEIAMLCGTAQSALDKIIHPAYASLNIMPNRQELEDAVVQSGLSHHLSHQSNSSRARFQDNTDDSELEITDAVSMSSNGKISTSKEHFVFHPKHRSTAVLNDITARAEFTSPVHSTPHVSKMPPKESCSPAKNNEKSSLNVQNSSDRKSTVDLTSPSPSHVKVTSAQQNNEKEDVTKTVDLTMSDKSDDDDDDADISEVPCEIDLADSDDDKSNLSMCSQTTLSTPLKENSQAPKADVQREKVSPTISVPAAVVDGPADVGKAPEDNAEGNQSTTELPTAQPSETTKEAEASNLYDIPTQTQEQIEKKNEDPVIAVNETKPEEVVSDKKRNAEDGEETSPKKQKLGEDFEFDSCEEDALLLSFQDVVREELDEDGE
ncbi:proline-, glutamic acid- and leucine-rich protein 1 [Frankliniella occidentalis]|uniref:Proline-, glutamic acid- and leucine-rich protein 1 n=1 Tax=Frankliniella occidentalis TaxID=133901 RepID=A0A6J1TAR8_FRAOC|nr:proline-, glutamic acid- and leucine-rich protein 1 [Frankliniella occidentalis]